MPRSSPLLLVLACLAHSGCAHDVSLGGPGTLVRVDDQPAGADCERGGVAVNTGLDRDGDLYLDADEVSSVQFVCNGSAPVACQGGTVVPDTLAVRATADLAQLDGVHCVDGDLFITGVDAASLTSLGDLEIVTGDVVIAANPNLAELRGIGQLREVGGTYLIQGNDGLTDLAGLGSIERARSIAIVGNNQLETLAGLEHLSAFAGGIQISNNQDLVALTGLDNLVTLDDTLSIRANRSLTSLAALGALKEVVVLEVVSNSDLVRVDLPALEAIKGRMIVNANPALEGVTLPLLVTAGDTVRVEANAGLVELYAPRLLSVGNLTVADAALTELALRSLLYTTGRLELKDLGELATTALGSMVSVGGDLVVERVAAAAPLGGFGRLSAIGGNFVARNNQALAGFTGLGALDFVAGNMIVSDNPALTSFAGLESLTEVDGALSIIDNRSLPTSRAQALASAITVGGAITIAGNRP